VGGDPPSTVDSSGPGSVVEQGHDAASCFFDLWMRE
jgi:hypothetical protein